MKLKRFLQYKKFFLLFFNKAYKDSTLSITMEEQIKQKYNIELKKLTLKIRMLKQKNVPFIKNVPLKLRL